MKNKSSESISSLLTTLIIFLQQISNYFNEKINSIVFKAKKLIFHILALKTKTIFLSLTVPEDVEDLSSMRTNKASGPNSI